MGLVLDSGVRSMERRVVSAGPDPVTGEERRPELELMRRTTRRRVYTQAQMDLTAESLPAVFAERANVGGLGIIFELKHLRFFQARFAS